MADLTEGLVTCMCRCGGGYTWRARGGGGEYKGNIGICYRRQPLGGEIPAVEVRDEKDKDRIGIIVKPSSLLWDQPKGLGPSRFLDIGTWRVGRKGKC